MTEVIVKGLIDELVENKIKVREFDMIKCKLESEIEGLKQVISKLTEENTMWKTHIETYISDYRQIYMKNAGENGKSDNITETDNIPEVNNIITETDNIPEVNKIITNEQELVKEMSGTSDITEKSRKEYMKEYMRKRREKKKAEMKTVIINKT